MFLCGIYSSVDQRHSNVAALAASPLQTLLMALIGSPARRVGGQDKKPVAESDGLFDSQRINPRAAKARGESRHNLSQIAQNVPESIPFNSETIRAIKVVEYYQSSQLPIWQPRIRQLASQI